MFVMNCTVDKEEVLRYKTANKRKQNRTGRKPARGGEGRGREGKGGEGREGREGGEGGGKGRREGKGGKGREGRGGRREEGGREGRGGEGGGGREEGKGIEFRIGVGNARIGQRSRELYSANGSVILRCVKTKSPRLQKSAPPLMGHLVSMRRADPRPASLARAKDSGDIRHLASRQAAWELGAMPHFRRRREGATIPGASGPCDLPRRREGATIPGVSGLAGGCYHPRRFRSL
ncbi:hypothetical protein G5714_024583 [Onychostoma macrolepis]|uniref:Uncharacterized protein n=1 Tax=Onychostoma macrolepis TaxID=369639 RepID=A0A7J6BHB6_9TELE|nr:hypothetical protein G5714_024583 [Onychostoma macrolepis]